MSVALDIATHLQSNGYGPIGNGLSINKLMDTPNNQVVVYQSPVGMPAAKAMGTTIILQYPSFQIVVRNTSSQTAESTCEAIHKLLDGAKGLTLNGITYYSVEATDTPFKLTEDDNKRYLYAFNGRAVKDQS